ncbi:MAG TPA: hypothetical protein VKZ82_04015 [Nonomuraea sp.]|nr:hypothetical protein [Nonomuraea sp.]
MRKMTVGLVLLMLAGCGQAAERTYQPQEAAPATGEAQKETAPAMDEAAPETSAPSESPSVAARAPRPASAQVGDLKVRFDWPEKDTALLRLFPEYYVAMYRAVIEGDNGFLDHVVLDYRPRALQWASEFTDAGEVVAGRSRLYRMKVNAVVGKGAEVDTCVDERAMKVVSADTGEPVKPQPTELRRPYLQRIFAHKDGDGVWRIKLIGYDPEGCP